MGRCIDTRRTYGPRKCLYDCPGPKKRSPCILIHQRWLDASKSFQFKDERTVFLDLEADKIKLRLTSVHPPHAGILDDVYEAALMTVEEVIQGALRSKSMNIVGIDANAVIGGREATDDERVIGAYKEEGAVMQVVRCLQLGYTGFDLPQPQR